MITVHKSDFAQLLEAIDLLTETHAIKLTLHFQLFEQLKRPAVFVCVCVRGDIKHLSTSCCLEADLCTPTAALGTMTPPL